MNVSRDPGGDMSRDGSKNYRALKKTLIIHKYNRYSTSTGLLNMFFVFF